MGRSAIHTLLSCVGLLAALPAMAAAAPVTVYAAGDIGYCEFRAPLVSPAAATAALVERELARDPAAAVLTMGDNVYQRGTGNEFATCYEPTWGRFKSRTWPSPGNREYATAQGAPYFAYFGKPAYYSFELGSWHLVSLDSNLQGEAHQRQLAWLKADLAAHPARCTLAYWHHPLYSSGGHGNVEHMREAWQILYDAGAEIVLAGHDHDYERFAKQDAHGRRDDARGIREFVVGTGGAYMTPFLWLRQHSERRDNNRTGVLRLRLDADRYAWEFLEASYDGLAERSMSPPDRGSAACH
ncbi:alkaline phosphatase [Massilia arenosa]|uniref:Alkaline phosphatase n=1 Tax=Zemynaea arenosa TaxID=2561931 RepID=A0A4Y9SIU3_9BURK|nr:metallophosphoesterase [Massilia arenosa]TFW25455.1 alkaline phosphatase [Massilia arenosa]